MSIRVPGQRSTQAGSYAELDDRMLVLDFQAGHPEAFVEIHHRYAGLSRHVCARFSENPQDTEEAFQETWIRVFQALHRFNGRYALPPWISRIATNVSLDLIRARARRPLLDDHPIDEHEREDHADGPEETVERLIQRDLVIAVLSGLPDNHRRALALRELEGRSHKEIAAELEMTPAQAKALIHRAKGTFRREWLHAATERHGLAGIFLIPVLWAGRLAGIARRIADRAGEAAQVGGAEVVTHVTQVAASPVVPVAATGVGEKILVAGLTLLVAGGVTVGAATVARDRSDRAQPIAAPAAPVVTPAQAEEQEEPAEPAVAEDAVEKRAKGERHADAAEEVVPPVVEPSPPPSEAPSPTAEPSPPPSGEPSPPPTEPIPPPSAPGFTGSFAIRWASDDACGCGPALEVVASESQGSLLDGGTLTLTQTLRGGATDAEGDVAWPLQAEVRASLTATDGTLDMSFTLEREGDLTFFAAVGSVTAVAGDPALGEPLTFAVSGSYFGIGAGQDQSPIRTTGSFSAVLRVWVDGSTAYGLDAMLIP